MQPKNVSCNQHQHIFHHTGTAAEKKSMQVVFLTVSMMLIEIIAGWAFNSMALLADGWHMSTHAAALGISWAAFVLARRHSADRRFAFGTWKVEVLGGFASAIFLGLVGIGMAGVSVARLFHPVSIRYDQALSVAVVGLAVNVVSIWLLRDGRAEHAHDRDGRPGGGERGDACGHSNNINLRAAYLHVLADAATSVLAIGALLAGKFAGWSRFDPLMGIVGAALILRWTRSLLIDTGSILLDRETDSALSDSIRADLEGGGDARVSDLHVWRVREDKYACIAAVVAAEPRCIDEYKARLAGRSEVVHITIEVSRCEGSVSGVSSNVLTTRRPGAIREPK